MAKKKGKPKDSLAGESKPLTDRVSSAAEAMGELSEENKAKLTELAQGVDQGGEGEVKPEGEEGPKEGEVKEEPKKRRKKKKKVEPSAISPVMMEAMKPLISYPVDALLRWSYGKDVFPLSEEEKKQLAQATDALFNKWFPILIEKWSEEFAFGLVLLSVFSKRLIILGEAKKMGLVTEKPKGKVEEKPGKEPGTVEGAK